MYIAKLKVHEYEPYYIYNKKPILYMTRKGTVQTSVRIILGCIIDYVLLYLVTLGIIG